MLFTLGPKIYLGTNLSATTYIDTYIHKYIHRWSIWGKLQNADGKKSKKL